MLNIPSIFVIYLLLRLEYDENINYGNKEKAKVINLSSKLGPSSGEYGQNFIIDIKILSNQSLYKNKYSIYLLVDTNSITQNLNEAEFATNVEIGDFVLVKTLSSHQAKILSWKGKKINEKNNYLNKFGRWILILILGCITYFSIFKITKIIKK